MSAAAFSPSQNCMNKTVQRFKNMYYKKNSNKLPHAT